MRHLHTLGIYFGTKTFKTACGKTVKAADCALFEDTDCPNCRAESEMMHKAALSLLEGYVKAHGETEIAQKTRESLKNGPTYRSALIGG